MYDVEMMEMLTLIHYENKGIYEMLLIHAAPDHYTPEKATESFKPYQDYYESIMKKANRFSACTSCEYKRREENIREILKNKDSKTEEPSVSLE